MTLDPERLTEVSSSRLARELLSHGRDDVAGEVVRQSAQRAAEQALSGAIAGSAGAASLVSWSLAKWLGVLFGVGMIGAGIASAVASSPTARPEPHARSVPAGPAPGHVSEPTPVSLAELPVAPSASEAPRLAVRPQPSDALEREIGILDRARRSIASGEPGSALRELDEHAAELVVLSPEAQSLRVEALYLSGRDDAADRAADQFLANHPSSPLAARVLALKNARTPEAGHP